MPRLTLNRQAQVAYEAVRALSDERVPTWGNLPKDQKEARVETVRALRAGVTAEQAHVAASTELLRDGADPDELKAYEPNVADELTACIVRTLASH